MYYYLLLGVCKGKSRCDIFAPRNFVVCKDNYLNLSKKLMSKCFLNALKLNSIAGFK